MKASLIQCCSFVALLVMICAGAVAAPIDDFSSRIDAVVPAPGVDMPELVAARTAYKKGRIDECKAQLEFAKSKAANLPPVDLMMARLHFANNKVATGRALLEKVAAEHNKHPEVYLLFGNIALSEGRITDALLHFEKSLSFSPPENWTDKQKIALVRESFTGQAAVAERREDWFRAQVALRQLTKITPTDAKVRDRLGAALFMLGRQQEAFEQFQTSNRLDPSINPPEVSLAVMHLRMQETDKATKAFGAAARKYPADGRVHYETAAMYILLDQPDLAKRHADKAAEFGLDTLKLKMQRGYIARQLGDYAEAEKYFGEVVAAVPSFFEATNQLALVLSHQDDEAKKRRALELAVLNAKQYPKSSYALSTLGWVYYNHGRKSEAQRVLTAAASHSPVRSETLYFLGRVLWENGEKDDARKLSERVKLTVDKPGLFVLRPEAKKWIAEVAVN